MARITVEDCLEKIASQYDLVLLAKERTFQLNAGEQALVEAENDKNTVISLREIAEGKVSIKNLEDSAINRLRKQQETTAEIDDIEETQEDDFDKIYKGEVSKSGTAVLPSKRTRKVSDSTETKPVKAESTNKEKPEEIPEEEKTEEFSKEEKSK